MSLLFFLPFLTVAADDAANNYVTQIEKRIMAVWHLPQRPFDTSAVEAVRSAAPFPPVPVALQHLIGDLVIVLDPTPLPAEETPKAKPPRKLQTPRAPVRPSPKNLPGYEI